MFVMSLHLGTIFYPVFPLLCVLHSKHFLTKRNLKKETLWERMCDLRLRFILPLELSTWNNSGQDLASSLRAKSPLLYASIGAGASAPRTDKKRKAKTVASYGDPSDSGEK